MFPGFNKKWQDSIFIKLWSETFQFWEWMAKISWKNGSFWMIQTKEGLKSDKNESIIRGIVWIYENKDIVDVRMWFIE